MLLTPLPLVLDLDGTVIRTDTFHEMMQRLLVQKPWILLQLPFWFLKGRAYAKAQLVEHVSMNPETLPYNKQLLSFAQKKGQPLVLATGTDQRLAQKIADHLGIFQETIGTNGKVNMTGHQKGQALVEKFKVKGFDYAGDSTIDASVWQLSRKALVVYPKWGVLKKAQALKAPEHIHLIHREQSRAFSFFLALRPLSWILNLIAASTNQCIGLSLLSSGLLILNDLLLIEKERRGPDKMQSVFAKGDLHLITAFTLAPLLILTSIPFVLSISGGSLTLGLYIPCFLGLDRLTRSTSQVLRWTVLGAFQILVSAILAFKLLLPLAP